MAITFKVLIATVFFWSLIALAAEEVPVEYTGDNFSVRFNEAGELQGVSLEGHVKIIYQNMVITCDKAFLDRLGGTIQAEGNIVIESERGKFEADSLVYDLSSSSGVLKAARFAADPFYGQAEKLSRDKDIFLLENGYITTCNLARPHYRFACQRVEFKPGSYLKTGPARLILGEKLTVFYLPGWTYNLKTEKSPVSIIPGYRTSTGAGWFLTIAFNQTLVKDSDLTLSENLHLQRKAAGAGLNLESRERHLKSETLIVKKWRESEPDYGGIAEFQFSPPGKEEKLYFLADWRWMKNNNFFYDYFHETFLEKSRRYNYLSFTEALGSGWMNLQIRERARESILTVEQLPGFRFFLPLLPVGESPVYLSNDLEVGHFEVDGKESVRVVNSTTVEAGENIGVFKVKPWMSFSALEYTGSGSEIFRHPVELGLKISTLLARDLKHRYQEQLIPSLVLINRSFLSPEPDLPVYDNYELLTSGRFAGFDLDWNLWRQDTWMGHASVRSLYDLGRQKFADTVFNYELHPTGRVAFTGTNIWDFSEGSYRFGVNDVSVEGKGYRCSVGVRYQEKEVTGLESWLEQDVGRFWRYRVGLFYDFREGESVSQHYQFWRKLHCWTVNFRVGVDRRETSFFVMFYPSVITQPETWKERLAKWR